MAGLVPAIHALPAEFSSIKGGLRAALLFFANRLRHDLAQRLEIVLAR
jgi:hypothetical protein